MSASLRCIFSRAESSKLTSKHECCNTDIDTEDPTEAINTARATRQHARFRSFVSFLPLGGTAVLRQSPHIPDLSGPDICQRLNATSQLYRPFFFLSLFLCDNNVLPQREKVFLQAAPRRTYMARLDWTPIAE